MPTLVPPILLVACAGSRRDIAGWSYPGGTQELTSRLFAGKKKEISKFFSLERD